MEITPFFRYLVEGTFNPSQVKVEIRRNTLKRSSESEAYISRKWQEYGGEKRPGDEKVSRLRFVEARFVDNNLLVVLDPCISYRDYIGTRYPEFLETFGIDYLPATFSEDILVVTSDSQIVLTNRSKAADNKPGGLHASFGGHVNLEDIDQDNFLDLTKVVLREVEEESGIRPEEVKKIDCVGVIDALDKAEPAAIFITRINLPFREGFSKVKDEENRIFSIAAQPDSVADWLLTYPYAFTAPGLALLLHFGKETFGTTWYNQMVKSPSLQGTGVYNKNDYIKREKKQIELLETYLSRTIHDR